MNIAEALQEKSLEKVLYEVAKNINKDLTMHNCLEYHCDHCPEEDVCDLVDLIFMMYDRNPKLRKIRNET